MITALDAALQYAAMGYPIFPCRFDKKPATAHGYLDAVTNPEQIRSWWNENPAHNVGLSAAGALVMDFDTPDHPWLNFEWPANAPTSRTPRGGWHIWMRRPLGKTWKISSGTLAPAVDVRTDGGYAIEYPSATKDGAYSWVEPLRPHELLPAPPRWLVGVLDFHYPPEAPADAPPGYFPPPEARADGNKPGDDFNARGTWEEAGLFDAGWTWDKQTGDQTGFIIRPGKDRDTSATLGICNSKKNGWPLFYSFTGNAPPIPSNETLSRFAVYTILKHGGDYSAAARELGAQGYGDKKAGPKATPGAGSTIPPKDVASPRFEFIPHSRFMSGDYRPTWYVKNVLVKGQPGVIGGPSKMLKTSIAADLVISLTSGVPFLGKFEIPAPIKVAIVSGESGKSALQTTAKRIMAAKGIGEGDIADRLHWCFNLPTLSDLESLSLFVKGLESIGVEFVVMDPLYLMLGDVDEKSIFRMGDVLKNLGTMVLEKGITPILLHHANKQLPIGEVMELQHLQYAGCEQFMRQFILLNRREKYQQDGNHKFWARIGGSEGHGGLYGLQIEEGTLDENFGGRIWRVEVTNVADLPKAESEHEEKTKARVRTKLLKEAEEVLKSIDSERSKGEPAATKSSIREYTGWQTAKLKEVIQRMLETDAIETHEWKKASGKNARIEVLGYRRLVFEEQPTMTEDHPVTPDLPGDITGLPGNPGSSEGTPGYHPVELPPLRGGTPGLPGDPEPQLPKRSPAKKKSKRKKVTA